MTIHWVIQIVLFSPFVLIGYTWESIRLTFKLGRMLGRE